MPALTKQKVTLPTLTIGMSDQGVLWNAAHLMLNGENNGRGTETVIQPTYVPPEIGLLTMLSYQIAFESHQRPRLRPTHTNHVWSYDFVSVRTQTLGCALNMIDEPTRETL